MPTRNFIGSGQDSAHPLLDRDGQHVQQLRGVVANLMRLNTTYRVTHLYANEIYVRDQRYVMSLVQVLDWNIYCHKGCNHSNEATEMM